MLTSLCPHNFRLEFPSIERAALMLNMSLRSFIYLELFYYEMVVIDVIVG